MNYINLSKEMPVRIYTKSFHILIQLLIIRENLKDSNFGNSTPIFLALISSKKITNYLGS